LGAEAGFFHGGSKIFPEIRILVVDAQVFKTANTNENPLSRPGSMAG